MRSVVERLDKKACLFAVFLGVMCSVGLFCSLTAEITGDNSPGILWKNDVMVFARTLYYSLSADRLRTGLTAFAAAVLIYVAGRCSRTGKEKISALAFGIIFAVAQLIAQSYKNADSWDLLLDTPVNICRALLRGTAYVILFYYLTAIIREFAGQILEQRTRERRIPARKIFFATVALLLLCWLPYLVIFYPGTGNEDTVIQMMEYYKIPSYIKTMSPMPDGFTYMTNHHPYLLTLLFGAFFDLGLALGDIRIGIAVYTVLHMLFQASVFAGCLQYLRRVGVREKRVRAITLLLMLLPIFPLYAICMVKDTIYSAFCLICILMLYEMARTKGKVLESLKFDLIFGVIALLMILTKVFAMYILILVGIGMMIVYRRHLLRVAVMVFVPVLLYQGVFLQIVLPACNVAPGGKQEALSVFFQQTARYVTEYGDEVTEAEREAIDAILPYDELEELYNPQLCDPVKREFRQDSTSEELTEYFKVWFEMFRKHPDVYVEAFLNNTYQYYDINKQSDLEYYRFDEFLQEEDEEGEYTALYVRHPKSFETARYVIHQVVLAIQKTPLLNIFTSLGMLPWIMIFFLLYNLWRGRRRDLALLAIPFLTIAVCLVSPDNGNSRYVMPMFYLLPFLFALELLPGRDEREDEREILPVEIKSMEEEGERI